MSSLRNLLGERKGMSSDLQQMFTDQSSFSERFFDSSSLTQEERERLTMVFATSLQKEVGSLLDGINYRQHRTADKDPSLSTILHEGIDVWRYLIGIMNLWGITPEQFQEAFDDRDLFLRMRHDREAVLWNGEPVLIVDMDDVLTDFRQNCTEWAHQNFPGCVNEDTSVYYNIPQEVYQAFIDARLMRELGCLRGYVDAINSLYDQGMWIHILTARIESDLTLKYDTYAWLDRVGAKFHRVSFSQEKYLWLAQTDYYRQGRVLAAVDDSPKHAQEYAQHGVSCLVPANPYNADMPFSRHIFRCVNSQVFLEMIEDRLKGLSK